MHVLLAKALIKILGSNNLVYYRGAPSPELDKGDFPGVWVAKKKEIAEQYGDLWVFEIDPNARILKDPDLRNFIDEYFSSLDFYHMHDDPDLPPEERGSELLMFPDEDFVAFLRQKGFDGYEHGSDTFIFNTKKIKETRPFSVEGSPDPQSENSLTLFHGGDIGNLKKLQRNFKILTPAQKLKLPSTGGGKIGLSTTTDRNVALLYSSAFGNKSVLTLYLSKNAKIHQIDSHGKGIDDMVDDDDFLKLQEEGYDAIHDVGCKEKEYRLLDSKNVKAGPIVDLSKKTRSGLVSRAEVFSKEMVDSFSKHLEGKYGLRSLELRIASSSNRDPQLKIDAIVVPKEKRGEGVGSKVMKEIVDFADKHNKIIVLSPSVDFGATSVSRLEKFYRGFGFLKNAGKSKDFAYTEAMIRYPYGESRSKYLDRYLEEH